MPSAEHHFGTAEDRGHAFGARNAFGDEHRFGSSTERHMSEDHHLEMERHLADAHHFGDVHAGVRRFPAGGHYIYHGHSFDRFRVERYRWPTGFHYVHYGVGYVLPRRYWLHDYYVTDYVAYGLEGPPQGFVWLRYGPDLVLMNANNGTVAQEIPGAFYEGDEQ